MALLVGRVRLRHPAKCAPALERKSALWPSLHRSGGASHVGGCRANLSGRQATSDRQGRHRFCDNGPVRAGRLSGLSGLSGLRGSQDRMSEATFRVLVPTSVHHSHRWRVRTIPTGWGGAGGASMPCRPAYLCITNTDTIVAYQWVSYAPWALGGHNYPKTPSSGSSSSSTGVTSLALSAIAACSASSARMRAAISSADISLGSLSASLAPGA